MYIIISPLPHKLPFVYPLSSLLWGKQLQKCFPRGLILELSVPPGLLWLPFILHRLCLAGSWLCPGTLEEFVPTLSRAKGSVHTFSEGHGLPENSHGNKRFRGNSLPLLLGRALTPTSYSDEGIPGNSPSLFQRILFIPAVGKILN